MKNSVLFLTAIALMMVYSCSLKESTLVEERFEDVPLTVKATMADKSDSKTVLEDGNVLWTSGDAINLFFSNQSSGKFTTNIGTPATTAVFNGSLSVATGSAETGTTGKSFWAVYPYSVSNSCDGSGVVLTVPSVQESLAGSFADKLNPSVATSPSLDLSFYNVCAPFYFSVTQSGVMSVTFRGNNDEDVAGQVRVTMDANGLPATAVVSEQGAKSITITAPYGGFVPGTTYVLVLLPQTLAAGYTLTLNKVNAVAECVVSKKAEFIRSQGRSKMNADEGLIYTSVPVLDAIDLGLSVKWRNRNIGADNHDDYGDYYAWGEIKTKKYYTVGNYKWCNGTETSLTKYNNESEYGVVDDKLVLDAEDDVAQVKLGGSWRMPTKGEFAELAATWNNPSYKWEWKQINGHNGWMISYLVNGQCIFLPAAGFMGKTLYDVNSYGLYSSSSLANYGNVATINADMLNFSSGGVSMCVDGRPAGCPIRPVYAEIIVIDVESVVLNKTELNLTEGTSETLIATVKPDNATDKTLSWTSSDPSVATIENGKVTAIKEGTATITAQAGNQTASCEVVVFSIESVDLGLSVKWASCNLGASSPEDYGYYYAWGEIVAKNLYAWSTYMLCKGSATSLTKYNTKSSYGTVDNKTKLEVEDDVAHVKLGGNWRMPTANEFYKLRVTKNNPSYKWEWKQINGHNGWEITYLNNNKSIFLPAAGFLDGTNPSGVGSAGNYWSSSLNVDYSSKAWQMYFDSGKVYENDGNPRYRGFPIRPVTE